MKTWLKLVLFNIIWIAIMFGSILVTLTYTQVPFEWQHYWFGNDLHQFLIYVHALTLGLTIIGSVALTTTYIIVLKK